MKNLRTYKCTDQTIPEVIAGMKEAGFKFVRDECPVKLETPWDYTVTPDGEVTYRQWDVEDEMAMQVND